ncbi:hypothetical protein [Actinacidiphila glaucinigra]|uniref:hypothetical protein n=1 Tax=Actinacidiphila glaucinigra TaxID=235986 RepID=UPI0036725190
MPVPDGVATVTVTSGEPLTRPDGTAIRGRLLFGAPDLVVIPGARYTFGGEVAVDLVDGMVTVDLVPPDVATMDPQGWTYTVRSDFENAPNWTRHILLSGASDTVTLAEVLVPDPVAGEFTVLVDPSTIGAGFVSVDGNQTIHGEKTFDEFYPVGPGFPPAFDNQLVPLFWVRDNFLPATGDVVGRTRAVHKTADEQVTSATALQDDDHLALTVAANAVYALDMYVDADADPNADITLGWSAPAGATMSWTEGGISAGNGNNIGSIKLSRLDVATSSGIGLLATGTAAMPRGVVRTGGTAGTLRLRWAQTVLSGTPTILRAGSWLRLHRIV